MKHFLTILTFVFLTSCGNDGTPDVVKFQSGAYGSKQGQFLANFLGKPTVFSQHYQLGTSEYDEYFFQYKVANEHIYNVSYVDFPPELLKAWDLEQLFDQSAKNMSVQIEGLRITNRTVNNEPEFEKSITYTLFSSEPGVMMKVKTVKFEGRVYNIFFGCTRRQPEEEDIDAFINSFKIYKPKESA